MGGRRGRRSRDAPRRITAHVCRSNSRAAARHPGREGLSRRQGGIGSARRAVARAWDTGRVRGVRGRGARVHEGRERVARVADLGRLPRAPPHENRLTPVARIRVEPTRKKEHHHDSPLALGSRRHCGRPDRLRHRGRGRARKALRHRRQERRLQDHPGHQHGEAREDAAARHVHGRHQGRLGRTTITSWTGRTGSHGRSRPSASSARRRSR